MARRDVRSALIGALAACAPALEKSAPHDAGAVVGEDAAEGSAAHEDTPDVGAPSPVTEENDADATARDAAPPRSWELTEPSAAIDEWLAYERAPEFSVMTSAVRVPMRDGVTLACNLSRPGNGLTVSPDVHPGLVVELTPYALLGGIFAQEAAFFTARGYDTLVCTVRGVGGSDGAWRGAASSQDRRDAHDLVEWLARQPHSTGMIGQFGESYGGGTSYGGAIEHPEHLRAIAPLQSPGSLYDDVNYPGGVETVRDGTVNNWPPIAETLSFGAIDAELEYAAWHAHPTRDAYWEERAIASRLGDVDVPVLAVGGWVDGYFRSGTLANIEAAPANTWAFYGQWTHIYPVDLGVCGLVPCADRPLPSGVLLAWFDRWLGQRNTPVPDAPVFVSEEGPREPAESRWREVRAWLADEAAGLSLRLGADGTLTESADDAIPLHFRQPLALTDADGSLSFTSAPLSQEHVLLGHPRLAMRVALDGSDANFYVEVLDVDASGAERRVNDGFLRASHRVSSSTPTPADASAFAPYLLRIRPQHYRFAAGHRLRIRLSGGAADTVVHSSPVKATLETGATCTLFLPGWDLPPSQQ